MTKPNSKNFCGGNFSSWLEIMLEPRCNGKCSFCIEKDGFRPNYKMPWKDLADAILKTNKQDLILLGGDPSLYPHLGELVNYLHDYGRSVSITTNGGRLKNKDFCEKLQHISHLNISIHHFDLAINKQITGIELTYSALQNAIARIHRFGTKVRINCNCIGGYIDSKELILMFINGAKDMGADSVRFAELKNDGRFVDLAKIFDYQYGLNDEPFTLGCHQDAVINGMPINFRQMCGLQTDMRPKIIDPEQILKQVMYYNGKIYNGWQKERKVIMKKVDKDSVKEILDQVRSGKLSVEEAQKLIQKLSDSLVKKAVADVPSRDTGVGCVY